VHLFLTDRLCCPRCGPEFGLILLAHDVRDRRVLEGDLGCPNCREKYPVREGFGDLRAPPRSPLPPSDTDIPEDELRSEKTLRLAASLGVTEGPGTLLIRGPAAQYAGELSRLIGEVEVVGMEAALSGHEEAGGVSRMVAHPTFPFYSGTFRGVLLSGGSTQRDLQEAARVVALQGRVVLLDGPSEGAQMMEALGLRVLLEEEEVLVAQKEEPDPLPLVSLRGL
jgi:uncharacterized protein YbaR (Trm112 family)